MFRKRMFGAFVGLAMAGMAGSAQAALMTRTTDFSASFAGTGAPIDPVAGSFTVTFDPSVAVTAVAVDAFSINIALTTPGGILFTYPFGTDEIIVYDPFGGNGVGGGSDDFWLRIRDFSTGAPTFFNLVYAQASVPDSTFNTLSGSVAIRSVPEPASLLLFGGGLAGLAFAMWRRKRAIVQT